MEVFTFKYRDGETEISTMELPEDLIPQKKSTAVLRGSVNSATIFGAGWYCPDNNEFWEYGNVDKQFMLDKMTISSNCCGAKVEGEIDWGGRCSECYEFCGVEYVID